MANNYLITGYWGEPHVTAENDRGIHAAIFGSGRFVLPVGEQFRAEYIGNNTVRMFDGKLMNNGAAAGIPVGEFVNILIPNAGQGMKRNDLIVFQYEQDTSTLIEKGTFVVVHGEETDGAASDPELMQNDLLSGTAVFDQMALWRVSVSGTSISAPVKVFDVSGSAKVINNNATLGTSWSGSAPYTQAIAVPGILETDRPHIIPVYSSDLSTALAQREAWGMVCDVDSGDNELTFTCFEEKPTVAIPIQIEVIR